MDLAKEVPLDVIKIVLTNVDFVTLQLLRKVCVDVRYHIDHDLPKSDLDEIKIYAEKDVVTLELAGRTCYDEPILKTVKYQHHDDGCFVLCGRSKKFLEFQDYIEVAGIDLVSLLKHQKGVLNSFQMEFPFSDLEFVFLKQKFHNVFVLVKEHLETRPEPLKVKEFHIETDGGQLIMILPYLDVNSIKGISISKWSGRSKIRHFHEKGVAKREKEKTGRHRWVRRIRMPQRPDVSSKWIELDQWKSLRNIYIDDFVMNGDMDEFLKIKKGSIRRSVVTDKELHFLRDEFLKSSDFEKLYVRYDKYQKSNIREEEFRMRWQRDFTKTAVFNNDTTGRTLKVTHSLGGYFLFSIESN